MFHLVQNQPNQRGSRGRPEARARSLVQSPAPQPTIATNSKPSAQEVERGLRSERPDAGLANLPTAPEAGVGGYAVPTAKVICSKLASTDLSHEFRTRSG